MIQTQTLYVDKETQSELTAISKEIEANRGNPGAVSALIEKHDAIMKRAPARPFDPRAQ